MLLYREVDVLLGESIGLQDVLVDCGEEAAARAVHLAELEAQLASSTARVQEVLYFPTPHPVAQPPF